MQPRPSSSSEQCLAASSDGTTRFSHSGSAAPSSSQIGPATYVVPVAPTTLLVGVYTSTSVGPSSSTPSSTPSLCTSPSATEAEQMQLAGGSRNDSAGSAGSKAKGAIKAVAGRGGRKRTTAVIDGWQWRQAVGRRGRRGDAGGGLRGCIEEEYRVMAVGVAADCSLWSRNGKEEGGSGVWRGRGWASAGGRRNDSAGSVGREEAAASGKSGRQRPIDGEQWATARMADCDEGGRQQRR
ncbi:hypothetical protein BHE74_00043432 [Ensete ventricosum]|nr:hypothetical protein GW17_00028305 [Ensete ventricosum]RWW50327.1 hypothetical protein BHE74_00043432 [Ensete ventricosum]